MGAELKKEVSLSGQVLNAVLRDANMSKLKLAQKLGISETAVNNYLHSDMKFSTLMNILEILDYDLTLEKSSGMGRIRVKDEHDCDTCPYKVFSDSIEEVIDRLRISKNEAGTEIDFYADSMVNKPIK